MKKKAPSEIKTGGSSARTTGVKAPAGGAAALTQAKQANAADLQLKIYDDAIRLFSQGKLTEARDRFVEVAKGPAPHISDKARSYARVCEQRTTTARLEPRTAEEHFTFGVERLNARDVERAKLHLTQALSLEPKGDHILYTMALCCGLAGDGSGACENLRRAIDLEPRNRILARQDPEFSALASQLPALRALLSPERA